MKYEFQFSWAESVISEDEKKSVEKAISDDQESGHSPVTFCHEGTVIVTLATSGPMNMSIVGNMKCHCGKPRAIIRGKVYGPDIALEPVDE